jgi:hypothetical protein
VKVELAIGCIEPILTETALSQVECSEWPADVNDGPMQTFDCLLQ